MFYYTYLKLSTSKTNWSLTRNDNKLDHIYTTHIVILLKQYYFHHNISAIYCDKHISKHLPVSISSVPILVSVSLAAATVSMSVLSLFVRPPRVTVTRMIYALLVAGVWFLIKRESMVPDKLNSFKISKS